MRAVERLVNLIAFLLDTREPVPVGEIRRRVAGYDVEQTDEAFARMFERDKAALRELDIPLAVDQDEYGEPGYAIDAASFYLPPIQVDPDEALALRIAANLLASDPGYPLGNEIWSAFAKLACSRSAPDVGRQDVTVCLAPEAFDRQRAENLVSLRAATEAKKTVCFSYYSISSDTLAKRAVEPYGLFNASGHWYLVGRCLSADDIRTFRLSRIKEAVRLDSKTGSGPDFDLPREFDVRDHIRKPWEIGERSIPATLRFSPHLASWAKLNLAPNAEVSEEDDGSLLARLDCRDEERFFRWLFSFGTGVTVVDPPALGKAAAEKLSAVLARYEEGPR